MKNDQPLRVILLIQLEHANKRPDVHIIFIKSALWCLGSIVDHDSMVLKDFTRSTRKGVNDVDVHEILMKTSSPQACIHP